MRHFNPNTDPLLFACPCCGEGKPSNRLKAMLDELREEVGFGVGVSSGPRCEAHNASVLGHRESEHLVGDEHGDCDGVDIPCDSSARRFRILEAAYKLGFTRIGVGSSFIHLGVSEEHPQHVMWVY